MNMPPSRMTENTRPPDFIAINESLSLPENRTEADWRVLNEALAQSTQHEANEAEPGVYRHAFTPIDFDQLIRTEPPPDAGQLSVADIDELLEKMFATARSQPEHIYISIEDMRYIRHWERIGRLYHAHPVPRRKIRKCHLSKLQTRWRKGRTHIRRVERAERSREEAEMRKLREEREG